MIHFCCNNWWWIINIIYKYCNLCSYTTVYKHTIYLKDIDIMSENFRSWMAEILDADVGENGEISSGELFHGSSCNIFLRVTKDARYAFAGVEKLLQETSLLAFFLKIEISSTYCRNLMYYAGQEIRHGLTRPGDII